MDSAKRKILVVDDSEDVREFFRTVFELAGYQVDVAENGQIALEKVRRERPDVILVDAVMPVMDGFELLLRLRSDLAPPIPPAILCSGFDLTEEEALRRGAVRFLRKPVDARDLLRAADDVLAGRGPEKDAIADAYQRTSAARRRARETSAKLLRDLEDHTPPGIPPFEQHARELVAFVRRYLGVHAVVGALVREDRLPVLCASPESWMTPRLDLGALLPPLEDVVEAGSALVLPDVTTHPTFFKLAPQLGGVRCLMAVPIIFAETAIGVLSVLDACACGIEAEDLAVVRLFAGRGSALLGVWASGRLQEELTFRGGPGVSPRRFFERMLDVELRLLAARGGSLELAILTGTDSAQVRDAVARAADPARLLAGRLSEGRIAIYQRDVAKNARAKLTATIDDLRSHGTVGPIGVVDLAARGLSSLRAADVLSLAEHALDDAIDSSVPVHRLSVQEEGA
jgi:CheY-like chemotaxis protein